MIDLKIDYLGSKEELEGYNAKEKFYSYQIFLNKEFNSVDEIKSFLGVVSSLFTEREKEILKTLLECNIQETTEWVMSTKEIEEFTQSRKDIIAKINQL